MMRVSHFNTFPYGGAGIAARRLNKHLSKLGLESKLYFRRSDRDGAVDPESSLVQLAPMVSKSNSSRTPLFRRHRAKRRLREIWRLHNDHIAMREPGQETFSMARLPEAEQLNWMQVNADVAHLHWISFFADYPEFFKSIPAHIPLVFTLHDMNAFTGGCHYSNGCEKFSSGCGTCPQVVNASPRDVSVNSFDAKRKSLAGRNIHVVAPCQWMLNLAQQSSIWPDSTSFHHIRYGFNLKKFHAVDREHARRQLGIKSDAVLIGFGADDVKSPRKGVTHLLDALGLLSTSESVECLVYGGGDVEARGNTPKLHRLGYVDSIDRLRLIYSAADIFVVPSMEDNQPQVGLEAMACSTPLVAFDTCGIPEMVHHGKNGLLATTGDAMELAKQISWLVGNPEARLQMGEAARAYMEEHHDSVLQAKKYSLLYKNATQFGRRLKVA